LERVNGIHEVMGSTPFTSTKFPENETGILVTNLNPPIATFNCFSRADLYHLPAGFPALEVS
ncbi:hypothetical protein S1OALGB6SA_1868, partial [Olavius algarvensis spirochete endosymbiont]|uniref:hypothetical protein n=1 Tax=Olavius algarvensis spirochete endosymbiont TaxID=260710 RepID=UPI000F1B1745